MKTKLLTQSITALFCSLMLMFAQQVFAAAGDDIENIATVEYQVASVTQTVVESSPTGNSTPGAGAGVTTTVVEDQLINFAVVTADTDEIPTTPGATQTVTSFTVYNIGSSNEAAASSTVAAGLYSNGTITVGLDAADNSDNSPFAGNPANDFAVGACVVYSDAAATTVITEIELAANSSAVVYVACPIPVGPTQDQVSTVSLQGTVEKDYLGDDITGNTNADANTIDDVEYVFADPTGVLGDADNDKVDSDLSAYIISTAVLDVEKTATVISDPINGVSGIAKVVPGSVLQYEITVENTGTVTANNVTITDTLPADLSCVATADVATAPGATDPVVSTTGSATSTATPTCSGTAVSGVCDTIPAGDSCTLTFTVQVQAD